MKQDVKLSSSLKSQLSSNWPTTGSLQRGSLHVLHGQAVIAAPLLSIPSFLQTGKL